MPLPTSSPSEGEANVPPTAAELILLAASDLHGEGGEEFSEWDLTVAAWKRDADRFGCRGYEDLYPDHKRVMMEIMSRKKKDNPLRRGWMEKVRPNYYRVTPLGIAEARRVTGSELSRPTPPSPHAVYDAVVRYVEHPVFRRFLEDSDEPRSWPGVASFLNLNQMTALELDDSLRAAAGSIEAALDWFAVSGEVTLRRGRGGGGRSLLQAEIQRLPEFLDTLETRFAPQMEALRQRT